MINEATPAFSIIIPTYNGQHVIERCIQSILRQAHYAFELILINDGSTNQTNNICQKYCTTDKRIKYFQQISGGVSSARNHGLNVAQNEYLLFVDADDYLLPNFLSALSDLLIENNLNKTIFIFQNFIADITLANGEKESFNWCKFSYGKYKLEEAFEALNSMNWLNWGVPFAKVYRNSIVKSSRIKFNENMSFREDLLFMLEYMNHVETIMFDPTANYCYTIDNTKKSLSNTTASFANEIIFFEYSKKMASSYINKLKLHQDAQLVLQKMVYASFSRCINSCMYKYEIPMAKQERVNNIRLLATEENLTSLLKADIIDTKAKKLAFSLLRNKLYKLCDIVNTIHFSLS